jgi:hypothetical protein
MSRREGRPSCLPRETLCDNLKEAGAARPRTRGPAKHSRRPSNVVHEPPRSAPEPDFQYPWGSALETSRDDATGTGRKECQETSGDCGDSKVGCVDSQVVDKRGGVWTSHAAIADYAPLEDGAPWRKRLEQIEVRVKHATD